MAFCSEWSSSGAVKHGSCRGGYGRSFKYDSPWDEILHWLCQYFILLVLREILQEGDVAIGEEFVHGFDDKVPGVVLLVVKVDLPR